LNNQNDNGKKVIKYPKGLMERSETAIFLLLIIILEPWRFVLLWAFSILIFLTAILRLKDAYYLFESN